jgi:hypothetical protein
MKAILALVAALLPIAFSTLQPCSPGKGPLPKSVKIVSCDNNEDCEFYRGKPVVGDFEFVARESSATLSDDDVYFENDF